MKRESQHSYGNYALGVLVLVYVINFIDRQILSILAEDIKADLGLSDATIGFLYGTAFAVFYAIFGIPLARLADVWVRTKLIATGLCFWSVMTTLSGMANSFSTLAVLRIGVGVGESSASPAAFSLLGDYFPPRMRATVVAIYSGGIYIGIGLGIFLGGWIVQGWNSLFPQDTAPLGLAGWQVAFFAVGLPGLAMAAWVRTLREPTRGVQEGLVNDAPPVQPLTLLKQELMSVLPPLTLISLHRSGAGIAGLLLNLLIALSCSGAAWVAIRWLGTPAQWIALAIGAYSFASWVHGLALRDREAFTMIYRSRAMVTGMIGFGWIAFVSYGVGFWGPPFFLRVHGVNPGVGGTVLGLSSAIGGWLGVTLGGVLSDRMKISNPRARPLLGIFSAVLATPAAIGFALAPNLYVAYACCFLFQIASSAWIGPAVALTGELVLPRMRATASAFYILSVTFIGLALGPYAVGQFSDRLVAAGHDSATSLRWGIMFALLAYIPALLFLVYCSCVVEREERHLNAP